MTSPLDSDPHDPARQAVVIAQSLLGFIDAVSILCGEGFLTHDEHEQVSQMVEVAARRWTDQQQALKNLDFEP